MSETFEATQEKYVHRIHEHSWMCSLACFEQALSGSFGSASVKRTSLSFFLTRHSSSSYCTIKKSNSNYGIWFWNRRSASTLDSTDMSSDQISKDIPPTREFEAGLPTVWNTVSGCLDSLPDPSSGSLKWYSCGPTVYDSAHLGHARTYVCLDVIRRVLTNYFRFDITYALGITDVDDKIIARARERGLREWPEIALMAGEYEKQFMDDMAELGVRPPDVVTRVTDHLPDIIAYIERIVENGMAYEAEGGIYFDVERMGSEYGKLGVRGSESTTPETEGGSDLRGKRSRRDFALWKRARPNEPWWESPFGRGRPGWHIECSAMTHALFGPKLDLHSGGIDLKFPHHTNEIAQCEAHCCGGGGALSMASEEEDRSGGAMKSPWVKHWVHTGHLNIEGLKMSKSLKNFVTVREYLERRPGGRRAAAEDFRMFCLMHKYNSTVTYSEDRMEEASVLRERFERVLALADSMIGADCGSTRKPARRWGDREKHLVEKTMTCRREVRLALSNDFDTPKVVRQLTALCAVVSTHLNNLDGGDVGPVASAVEYAAEMLSILGVRSSTRGSLGLGREAWSKRGDIDSAEGLPPARDVISAMVDLRRLVRKHVLAPKLGKDDSAAKLMKRDLLKLVDTTRDEVLPGLGVQVQDQSLEECTWMLLPTNRRHDRRKPDEEQDTPSLDADSEDGGSSASGHR